MKMRSHNFITCLLMIFLAGFQGKSQSQETTSFTLKQAITYALKNSPSANNAELDKQSAVYRKREIAGMGYPQISGSIDLKNYFEIPWTLIPAMAFDPTAAPDQFMAVQFGTRYNATAGFSASQLIFSSDYIFGLKASSEYMNLARINLQRTQTELAAEVSKAYYNVIINADRMKLLEANLSRLKKMLDDSKAFNEEGFAELIDVQRLEVQYNNLRTQKEQTVKLMGLSETMLKFQMGYELSKPIQLADSLSFNEEEYQALNTGAIDISQRPDYQLLVSQEKLYTIDRKRLQWGYLPTVAAYGSYQYNTMRQKTDFFDFDKNNPLKQWYKIGLVGATLNLNIFDGFQRHNKIQQARIVALKTRNDLRNLELAGELQATVAAISYNNAYSTLLMQKRNMELAQHVHEVTQKKYESGVGSNLEVVNAEADLQTAQTNYYNAVYDMLVAKTDYLRATGTILK